MNPRPAPLRRARPAIAIAGLLLLAGCSNKYYVSCAGCRVAPPPAPVSYVVLIPSPDGSIGAVAVKGDKGEQFLNKAGQAGTLEGQPFQVDDKKIEQDFGAARTALPQVPVRYQLAFKDGATLTAESEATLPEIVAEAKKRPAVDVTIIGHTDTLQSFEYNDKLGLKRATKVADSLRAKGLVANSLSVESYGERQLLVQTPDNTFEPRNRRVEISVR
ncbi:MAG: OmpA family protein [Betaproteobacteria bacterium]|nr:OmpA family protein [Betaproteobacteria bacterium]